MSRRLRTTALLLACLGAVVAVWLVGVDGSDPEGDFHAVREVERAEAERGPTLQAHGHAPVVRAERDESGIDGGVTRAGRPVEADVRVYLLTPVAWGRSSWAHDPGRWGNAARPVATEVVAAEGRSGADGRYAIDGLRGGHYRVVASAEGVSGSCRHLFLAGDGRRVQMDIKLPAGSASVTGRVRYESGQPWTGTVYATSTWDRRWFAGLMPGDSPGVKTDAEGRFTLRSVPYGPVRLQALDKEGVRILTPRMWVPHETETEIVVPDPSTWVDVTVVSAGDGRPIRGAAVLSTGYSKLPAASLFRAVQTDEEGHASLPVGTDTLYLRVEARGWARADVQIPKGERTAWITLSRTATVRGRVVAKDTEEPVVGMSVFLDEGCFAITGAGGRFELLGAPAGSHDLEGQGDGWRAYGLAGLAGGGWDVDLEPGATATVELVAWKGVAAQGRVIDAAGEGIAGAVVTAHWVNNKELQKTVRGSDVTAEDGSFSVPGLLPGTAYALRADAPGFGWNVSKTWKQAVADEPKLIAITLRPPRQIDVRVLDAGGEPVPGVRVAFKGREPLWTYVVTGDDGWVRAAPLPRDKLTMWARCAGFVVHTRSLPAAADDVSGPEQIELTLGGSATVIGRVVWADGTPATNHGVRIVGLDRTATTDDEGRFRIQWVADGEHLLRAKDERVDPPRLAEVSVRPGEGEALLRFEAPPPEKALEVEVRVTDEAGRPVGGASARARFGSNDRGFTADNGLLTLKGGWSELIVYAATSSTGAPLPLGRHKGGPHDGVSTTLEVRLPAELAISGSVRGEDGAPLGGAQVSVDGEGPDVDAVRTDATGSFRIGRLAAGRHVLTVAARPGYLAEALALQAGSHGAVLVVRRAAEVTITVVDGAGSPVKGANVRWQRQGDAPHDEHKSGTVATDAEGRVRPTRLDPRGTYRLTISSPGRGSSVLGRVVEGWQPADVEVQLDPSFRVQGKVVDGDGRPVVGVEVVGVHQNGDVNSDASGPDGRFTLAGLPAGRVELQASAYNEAYGRWNRGGPHDCLQWVESESVTVAAGARGVRIEIDAGLPLRIHALGWRSKEDKDVRAVLTSEAPGAEDDENNFANITADGRPQYDAVGSADGVFTFRHAPAGARYTVWIGPLAGGRYVYEEGLVGRREPYRVTIRAGGVVRGVVHAPHGIEARRVRVEGAAFTAEAAADANGTFEIRGVPPGRVTVTAYGGPTMGSSKDPWRGLSPATHRGRAAGVVGQAFTIHLREND